MAIKRYLKNVFVLAGWYRKKGERGRLSGNCLCTLNCTYNPY